MHSCPSSQGSVATLKATLCLPAGQPVLLPLTSSLYVAGTVESTHSVLIDIGTGYYMEVRCNTGPAKYYSKACHIKTCECQL